MSTRKDKHIRKIVRSAVGDQSRAYLLALLDNKLWTRFKYALIILFRLGYKDLVKGEGNG